MEPGKGAAETQLELTKRTTGSSCSLKRPSVKCATKNENGVAYRLPTGGVRPRSRLINTSHAPGRNELDFGNFRSGSFAVMAFEVRGQPGAVHVSKHGRRDDVSTLYT